MKWDAHTAERAAATLRRLAYRIQSGDLSEQEVMGLVQRAAGPDWIIRVVVPPECVGRRHASVGP